MRASSSKKRSTEPLIATMPEGKPHLTQIEYFHEWFSKGIFVRALAWLASDLSVQQATLEDLWAGDYPNGPQRDWWKHAEKDASFDFFEHKNDLKSDADWEGELPKGTFDDKNWWRNQEFRTIGESVLGE